MGGAAAADFASTSDFKKIDFTFAPYQSWKTYIYRHLFIVCVYIYKIILLQR